MKFICGVVFLIFVSIEARGIPKIQIFEIRQKDENDIELRDLDTEPNTQQQVEAGLLRLLNPHKSLKRGEGVAQQLIQKLKYLKGKEGNRISEDAYIYILHDVLSEDNNDSSSTKEFVDRTRNERTEEEERIRNILEKLLRQNDKKRNNRNLPLSLNGDGIYIL